MWRKAALIYNPTSGRQNSRRLAQIEAAAAVLQSAGVQTIPVASYGPSEAGEQARAAIAEGCNLVLACGGDGTINDVLQGVVFSDAALGVLPMGTANSLAHDLGVPRNAVAAAQALLTAEPHRIAVGSASYHDKDGSSAQRYFTVALGVGVDADLFYRINAEIKQRIGMNAYYSQALRLWFTHDLGMFEAEFTDMRSGETRCESVSQVLAVRITQFGGVLRKLAPGAALRRNDLQLILFKTARRVPYLLYMLRALLEGEWSVPGVELVHTTRLVCRELFSENGSTSASRIYSEADGEVLGMLPVEVTVVPNALTLLVPRILATEKVRDPVIAAVPRADAVS
jgi:diacylglycerol kinase (ATP)